MGNDMTTDMPQCIQRRCLARFDWQTENKKHADRSISTGWGWTPEEMLIRDAIDADENDFGVPHHEHTLTRYDRAVASARQVGHEIGTAQASWVGDASWSKAAWRRVLHGIEDIDPKVMDQFNEPGLSGEMADEMNDIKLMERIGWTDESEDDSAMEDWTEIANAYIDQARDSFWREVERRARYHTGIEV